MFKLIKLKIEIINLFGDWGLFKQFYIRFLKHFKILDKTENDLIHEELIQRSNFIYVICSNKKEYTKKFKKVKKLKVEGNKKNEKEEKREEEKVEEREE